ncbi:hypothetical protein [Glycomyces tenuis]|uniref:hypothetical protein n=1 Tax=Glycomyces tenuis TaxID=58116 RepID=UPI000558AAC6|nr:hypothetical protein [Glycomyces tenuis]
MYKRQTENRAIERREEADQQARDTMQRSVDQVRAVKSDSEAEAERIRRSAAERAEEWVQPLAEEVETLERQRDSAGSNLGDLRRQLGLVAGEDDTPPPPSRVPINRQREPSDLDSTQQLPVVG